MKKARCNLHPAILTIVRCFMFYATLAPAFAARR